MIKFTVALAGLRIEVNALFPSTMRFFRDYICGPDPAASTAPHADIGPAEEPPADFAVTVAPEDIDLERIRSAQQDEADGIPVRNFSDNYLETLAVLRHIADRLPDYDTILFHGSVIARNGKAYIFTAPSGTGKTTHIRLLLDLLPDAHVLNGDKPFLKVVREGAKDIAFACGNPWQGKENYGCNEILPLSGICLIEQSADNRISEIGFGDALSGLMRQVYRPESDMLSSVKLLGRIGNSVRLWRLGCNMDPEAALVSSGAMMSDDSAVSI